MAGLVRDVKYAIRGMRRDPAFAVAAIVMLTLAMGASTAVYTVADAVLFKMPFDHPDRIVYIGERDRQTGRSRATHPRQARLDYHRRFL